MSMIINFFRLIFFFCFGSVFGTELGENPSTTPASCLKVLERCKEDCTIVIDSCESFNLALLTSLQRLEVIYENLHAFNERAGKSIPSLYWVSQYHLEIHQLKEAEENNDWFELDLKFSASEVSLSPADKLLKDIKNIHKRYLEGLLHQCKLHEQIETLTSLVAYICDLEEEFSSPFTLEQALSICLYFRDISPEQNKFYEMLRRVTISLREVDGKVHFNGNGDSEE